ncbi:MAG: hypothetical protein JRF02_00335 [Deltaproteobacteria bacterium]|nr:hypothetical protein [Deltaproteobacteria bacterium]
MNCRITNRRMKNRRRTEADRELACAGCHAPHESDHKNLLIQTKNGGALCRVCHKR